jgi:hypothetical protein
LDGVKAFLGNEMDDQEILDLLAREIRDPDLRGRIFDLLERDPATLTPEERELVEQTVGGILSAETERLRGMTPATTPDDREDDISVRGYLRQLRWIAPGLLVAFLGLWASGVARGMSLPAAVFLWVLITVAVGPLVWLRVGVRRGTPRWWRALGLAVLWSLGTIALLGIGYALVTALTS